MALSPEERAKHYNTYRFTTPSISADSETFRENMFGSHTIAAIGYILGLNYTLPSFEVEILYPQRLAMFKEEIVPERYPRRVLDVGCGRGQLEAALMFLEIPFTAIDFSIDAIKLTEKTCVEWSGRPRVDKSKYSIYQAALVDISDLNERFDTVVFSESIEHIPEEDFDLAMSYFRRWHARLIIVNKIDYHPIELDGTEWNHIRRITDKVYDDICEQGKIVFRDRAHLVVQL